MPHNLVTLSRSALYDLIWSKPVRDLAARHGAPPMALSPMQEDPYMHVFLDSVLGNILAFPKF